MRTRRSQSSSDLVPSDRHHSVLLHEAIELLGTKQNDTVVDATVGGAGHSKALVNQLSENGAFIGFDLDPEAIQRARSELKDSKAAIDLIQANFRNLQKEIEARGIHSIDKVLFDLGWSSYQLTAGRGFSFLNDEPLLMTYGPEQAFTAKQIVNEWAEESIADVIFGWGEERYARRIARAIVERRAKNPFSMSKDLADCIAHAVPAAYRHGRIHPATRTFQALRIAVNDEMGALKDGLQGAWNMLVPGGRIAIISFHSIEDRIVKRQFMQWEKDGVGVRLNKKPVTASLEELQKSPRARSAKLRVIEKK